nr:hypothetical protein [Armatimonas sp.]
MFVQGPVDGEEPISVAECIFVALPVFQNALSPVAAHVPLKGVHGIRVVESIRRISSEVDRAKRKLEIV